MLSAFFNKININFSPHSQLLKRLDTVADRSDPHLGPKKLLKGKKEYVQKNNLVEQIAEDAKSTYPLVHEKVKTIIQEFITFKLTYGSSIEQKFYQGMDEEKFLQRLLTKRPEAFFSVTDNYRLSDGTMGVGGFAKIGTEEEKAPLVLKDYISYDEMKISALIGISGPTCLMNKGDPDNRGEIDDKNIEKRCIMTALVGLREEKEGVMEFQDTVITPQQNTIENGYGKEADLENIKTKKLRMWANFYGLKYYPTFAEAKEDQSGAYVKFNHRGDRNKVYYLNVAAYKARVHLSIVPYLLDADQRAKECKKSAYVQVPGIGLGAWNINTSSWLADLMIEVYKEFLDEYPLKNISDLNFSYFANYNDEAKTSMKNSTLPGDGREYKAAGEHLIKIHYSRRNVADPLPIIDKDKLLVVGFGRDSNAKLGNELWTFCLSRSLEPALVRCSLICFTHDPEINPENIQGKRVAFYGDASYKKGQYDLMYKTLMFFPKPVAQLTLEYCNSCSPDFLKSLG